MGANNIIALPFQSKQLSGHATELPNKTRQAFISHRFSSPRLKRLPYTFISTLKAIIA